MEGDEYIGYLEARVADLETDVQAYWDSAKRAEEMIAMVYEKLKQGHTYEALKLFEQGGE